MALLNFGGCGFSPLTRNEFFEMSTSVLIVPSGVLPDLGVEDEKVTWVVFGFEDAQPPIVLRLRHRKSIDLFPAELWS
ncbi:MAG TPA: hypothetical protein DDZ51_11510 [Planctomycetaceae bacterium]|nr:hypothetical protein [Planctomycetaceae bacterium]